VRVWISGATGLVGRHLRERLSGVHQLIAPTRAELDLFDRAAVLAFARTARPDAIVHCAGTVGGIQANLLEPTRFLIENIDVGVNVVLAAAAAGVPRLVNLASSCMYPRSAPSPLAEASLLTGELEPSNEGYALAKIVVERLCDYLVRERPERLYRTLVPCNLYGPWDSFDLRRSHMIPAMLRKLDDAVRSGADVVEIWGSGRARRELMYAGDLADFVALALERLAELPMVLNVGTGIDHSIDDCYAAGARVVGFSGGYRHDFGQPEGVAQKLVDISALARLGWRAPTSLEDGLLQTYRHLVEARERA
jgi:GDP-L-fucose synthase